MVDIYKKNYSGTESPFLSVITRCMKPNPRPVSTEVMEQSVKNQTCRDFEHIYLEDGLRAGMHQANKNMALASPHIKSKYVHMLDDDDYYTDKNFVRTMKSVCEQHNPDIVLFKAYIDLNSTYGKIYPTPDTWGKHPQPAKIGGICFILRASLWKSYIKYFAAPRMGDYNMLVNLYKIQGFKEYWHDALEVRTYKVGRGGKYNE